VFFCTGKGGLNPYLVDMIRPAPPDPLKTALLTFAIAILVAALMAVAPHPY
jgi:hypothetical protein